MSKLSQLVGLKALFTSLCYG